MPDQPLAVVGIARARADRVEELKDVLLSFVPLARAEPGCLDFHVHQDSADPRVLVLVEAWSSGGHLQRHLDQPYLAAFMAVRMRYLDEDIEVRSLRMQSPLPAGRGSA